MAVTVKPVSEVTTLLSSARFFYLIDEVLFLIFFLIFAVGVSQF